MQPVPAEIEIKELKKQIKKLKTLSSRYEKDVVVLRNEIAELKKRNSKLQKYEYFLETLHTLLKELPEEESYTTSQYW